ncbi:MAG: hypothetical protein RL095_2023, partial [Verrucomicrobiota bacterium]
MRLEKIQLFDAALSADLAQALNSIDHPDAPGSRELVVATEKEAPAAVASLLAHQDLLVLKNGSDRVKEISKYLGEHQGYAAVSAFATDDAVDVSGLADFREALSSLEAEPKSSLIVVDTRVHDWQLIAQAIGGEQRLLIVNPDQDGLAAVAAELEENGGASAVHFITHGQEGAIQLGNRLIDSAALNQSREALARIGAGLGGDRDILLYGCDSAKNSASFVATFAAFTGADVAASDDPTGASSLGGDWALEQQSGRIDSTWAAPELLESYGFLLQTVDLSSKDGWTAVMYGSGKDPDGDSQAGAADTDIIGDSAHGSFYVAYDDRGTAATSDDYLAFRLRIDNPTSSSYFGGVAVVGMDANSDGKIDIFMSVDGRNNAQAVKLLDPGTGLNNSPSTTTTSPLPTGWLPNNGVYPFSNTAIYNVSAVSALTDPHWGPSGIVGGSPGDLTGDGKPDGFVSWKIPMADLATVLAKPSPTDKSGTVGPRGTTGIAGFTKDTTVSYVSFTQTQPGPINGDLNGVGASYDKNASFASLGAFTAPMSASNPVPAGPVLTISSPISGGTLNDAEDDSVNISGTSQYLPGTTLNLSVSDGTTAVNGSTTVAGDGSWTVTGMDLSGLDDGTLTVTATVDPDANAGTNNNVVDVTSVLHDKTPPTVTITQPAAAISGTPTLSGTSNLPDGQTITVAIDTDNDGDTDLSYVVTVTGGIWSLNTATVPPSSGSMPSGGLSTQSKITATATDTAGNSATATALNRPVVNTLSTNDTTPLVSGTWANIPGDTLSVTVNGVSYTPTITGNTWTAQVTATLATDASYEVVATVTRGGSVTDTSSSELTITSTPVITVDITSGGGGATASGNDTTPTISGTSGNAGGAVIVRLDPGNDGNLSDAVTYSVTPDGSGNWTLDTGSATPVSGQAPSGGFVGAVGIRATDITGAVSDVQVLTITSPTIAISSITSTATTDTFAQVSNSGGGAAWLNMTEDNLVTVSGTATGASTVDITITDANGHELSYTGVSVSSGNWSITDKDLSSLDNGVLTVVATISGTSISATDTSVTHDKLAPFIINTTQTPIRASAGAVIEGSTDLPQNTTLTISIYSDSGRTTLDQSFTATVNADGSWSAPTASNLSNNTTYYFRVSAPTNTTDTAGNLTGVVDFVRTAQNSIGNSTKIIDIKSITGDNYVIASEIASGLTISGETSSTSATVTLLIQQNGSTIYTKTTTSGATYSAGTNNWSITLTNSEMHSLANGQFQVVASVPDGSITLSDAELVTLDMPSPLLTITDNTPGTAVGDVTYTFQFSDDVNNGGANNATYFTVEDITVTGGTKGTFTVVDANTYTLVVTPTSSSSGNIVVSVANSVATGSATGRGIVGDSSSQPYNTTGAAAAPTLSINTDNLATDSTPLITGTTSLAAGAPIVINVDTDNNGSTDLVYTATVQSGGTWSVDLGSATPDSGSLGSGLSTHAKFTAVATNAYNVSTSAVGQNKPAVDSLTTNDNTPTVSGTWTNIGGDTLAVTINGVSVTPSITGDSWTATSGVLADGTYQVVATVSRSGTDKVDVTTSELTVDTSCVVNITSTASTTDTTPVISGTVTGIPAGTVLTLELDADNNGSYELVYKTVVGAGGAWSLDTATASPFSGSFPDNGLNGSIPVRASASDPAGNSDNDLQTLVVDITPPALSITSSSRTADTSPLIYGTTDLLQGSTISVTINPGGGDASDAFTYNGIVVQTGGTWSLDTGSAIPSSGSFPVGGLSGATNTVTASGSDALGNSTTATQNLVIDPAAPAITIFEDIDWEGNDDGSLDGTEDNAVTIKGISANLANGSVLSISITDGTTTIVDSTSVTADAWALSPLNLGSLANGTLYVTATYLDDGGNAYSDTATVQHEKTGPLSITIDSISSDTGTPFDFITSDQTLVFKGSAIYYNFVDLVLKNSGGSTILSTRIIPSTDGTWTYNHSGTTLDAGNYTLDAILLDFEQGPTGVSVTQAIVIDTTAPAGPVTVASQTTSDTTPSITGTATLAAGESLSVSIDGVTYTVGDGHLSRPTATTWTLVIPAENALSPAFTGGFNGVYNVTATITDLAGNTLVDASSGEVTVTDTTAPVIDLDPSDGASLDHSDSSTNGAPVSLDDNADEATVVEASDKINALTITVGGLLDGNNEKLVFGSTTLRANGSDIGSVDVSDISVGGVRVNIAYAANIFSIQKFDYSDLSAAEVQAIARDIQYQNSLAASLTAGNRTFSFGATDDAGNTAPAAVSTINANVGGGGGGGDTTAPAAPSVDLIAASDTGSSATDDLTKDVTPTLRVSLNGSGATAPVAGDTVTLYENGVSVGTAVLTAQNITDDYVDITTGDLGAGSKSFTATVTDAGNNPSDSSSALPVTIDTAAPSIAISAIATDDVINASEAAAVVAISGTTSGVENGQTVSV